MPSASAKVEKQVDFLDSFKQAVIVVEHKIRNLEKRKGKLDSYKQEQEQGKELNGDQLAAVAKYGEVIQQLDLSRDLVKQISQIGDEYTRAYRKQQKKESVERAIAETDRFRQLLLFQYVLEKFSSNQRARQDFLNGVEGAVKLTQDDLNSLDQFSSLIFPDKNSSDYFKLIENAGEHIQALFQGKPKTVAGKNYKELQALLLSISSCEYFDPKRTEHTVEDSAPTEDLPAPVTTSPTVPQVPVIEPVPAQIVHSQQESAYNFMQESQIDITSPHMDPAVVAISAYPPPPLQAQQDGVANQNVFNASVENINNRLNDMSFNRQNTKSEEEGEWGDESIPNQSFNNSNVPNLHETNGRGDGNTFDRTVRGNFQRGRGSRRGMSNGYRGSSRGGRGHYQNGRGGGGYRNDYRNEKSDGDGADPNVFDGNSRARPKRRGGGYNNYSKNVSQNANHNVAYSSDSNSYGATPTGTQEGQSRPSRAVPSQQGRVNSFTKH